MRLIGYWIIAIVLVLGGWWFVRIFFDAAPKPVIKQKTDRVNEQLPSQNQQQPSGEVTTKRMTFVPYWANMNEVATDPADRLVYFGIAVNESGVVSDDEGYRVLDRFRESAGNKTTYLTVRMLDPEENAAILKKEDSFVSIAEDIAETAEANGFEGVVLDLEMGLLSFSTPPERITTFARAIRNAVRENDMVFAMTLYGDTFYRKRPYDVQALGKVADEIMIMTYDFTKSFGTPGPNFPLNGREEYGYDLTTMVDDFTQRVAKDKLTFVFGAYGYEWIVDEQERPLKTATAVTLNQANQRFLPACKLTACTVKRDRLSAESRVSFQDDEDRTHIVWFEDEVSLRKKTEFLQQIGIGSTGYWAYGYY